MLLDYFSPPPLFNFIYISLVEYSLDTIVLLAHCQ